MERREREKKGRKEGEKGEETDNNGATERKSVRFIVQGRRRASLRMNRILTSRIRMQKNEWYTVTNASPLKGKRDV